MLKSAKVYCLAFVSGVVMMLAGAGCLFGMLGPIIKEEKIYDEYKKTPAYTEYYQSNVKNYLEEYKNGKITEKEYDNLVDSLSVKDCLKQQSVEERMEIERKLQPVRHQGFKLALSGGVLVLAGMAGVIGVSLADHLRMNDDDEFER